MDIVFRKKKICTSFLLIIVFHISFAQVTNIQAGVWSNSAIWNNNHIPTSDDSVYLSFDIIIDINTSCKALNTNGHNVTVNSGTVFNVVGNVLDVDGNKYNTITIGTQVWLKENLNVTRYKNGDIIPQVSNPDQWANLTTGAWCYHTDSATGAIYGKLYNWNAVNDNRGLAPHGWHVPSDIEWTTLTNYLGGENIAGSAMKSLILWCSPDIGSTNSSGFTGLPGGDRTETGVFLPNIGIGGYFWSTSLTSFNQTFAWYRLLFCNSNAISIYFCSKVNGMSVRCIKN